MMMGMWVFMAVFMAVAMFIGVAALALLVTAVVRNSVPAKRKREAYNTDTDIDTFFDKKLKRGSKYILSDDGEMLEVFDNDWQTDKVMENYIDMSKDAN